MKPKQHRESSGLSPKERRHLEFFVSTVEKARAQPLSAAATEHILTGMRSDDPKIRATAVRRICPCRVSWEVFTRLRKTAKTLRHDANPLVAANALHIEQDARRVAENEARFERIVEHEQLVEDQRRARYRSAKIRPHLGDWFPQNDPCGRR